MEKKVFRTIDNFFYNSECLFIEYHDILNIPWLSLLALIKQSNRYSKKKSKGYFKKNALGKQCSTGHYNIVRCSSV